MTTDTSSMTFPRCAKLGLLARNRYGDTVVWAYPLCEALGNEQFLECRKGLRNVKNSGIDPQSVEDFLEATKFGEPNP